MPKQNLPVLLPLVSHSPQTSKLPLLVTLPLSKPIEHNHKEQARLYEASKSLGFFYLDLRGCREGEALLQDADGLFEVNKAFFDLPTEVKQQFDFASQGSHFGYKGIGVEVTDGKGTKYRNEVYNVRSRRNREFWSTISLPDRSTDLQE